MGKFDKKGGFGGPRGGGFQKRGGFDRERGGNMPSFKADCAECGKVCEVPFRPTNGKPVFCNDCFGAQKEMEMRAPRKEFGNRAFEKRNDRPSFDRGGRDNFKGRSEFPARAAAPSVNTEKLEKQMSDISFKLEKLTAAIEKMSAQKVEVVAPKVAAPVVEKKQEVKAAPKPAVKAVVKKAAPAKVAAPKKVVAPKKAATSSKVASSSKVVVKKKK